VARQYRLRRRSRTEQDAVPLRTSPRVIIPRRLQPDPEERALRQLARRPRICGRRLLGLAWPFAPEIFLEQVGRYRLDSPEPGKPRWSVLARHPREQ
jgi:hypothetical protein